MDLCGFVFALCVRCVTKKGGQRLSPAFFSVRNMRFFGGIALLKLKHKKGVGRLSPFFLVSCVCVPNVGRVGLCFFRVVEKGPADVPLFIVFFVTRPKCNKI